MKFQISLKAKVFNMRFLFFFEGVALRLRAQLEGHLQPTMEWMFPLIIPSPRFSSRRANLASTRRDQRTGIKFGHDGKSGGNSDIVRRFSKLSISARGARDLFFPCLPRLFYRIIYLNQHGLGPHPIRKKTLKKTSGTSK